LIFEEQTQRIYRAVMNYFFLLKKSSSKDQDNHVVYILGIECKMN